jgi:6-pyruvoyltetrahydropterin/6-carboxytetrahydropterin synthase
MIELARTVRFALNADTTSPPLKGPNGYGGVPAVEGLDRHYEMTVRCVGEPHAETGYLINIKDIDRAVRAAALPVLARASIGQSPAPLLAELFRALEKAMPGLLRAVRLSITPTHALETTVTDTSRVTIRQRFDFAAAHRLHVPSLSDEENREIFGKCNNPNGHGHNYQIEPAFTVDADETGFTLATLEQLTDETIIERFDHTHLNMDTEEFRDGIGFNPTVENIARVCHGLLEKALKEKVGGSCELASVTVWETDRTSATYPAS